MLAAAGVRRGVGSVRALLLSNKKAASELSSHDPPIVLAKSDASDEANRELVAAKYGIKGFPTIKILRDGGKKIQDYNGPREAAGIVAYFNKQAGPASAEIKSKEDSANLIDEKKIFVVGIFPDLSGENFENYLTLAEKLRAEIDFAHTVDAKFLPWGGPVDKPTLRLLKPFDELFVDFEDFQVDAMEKFITEASIPIVTIYDNDPNNHPYVSKFSRGTNAKVTSANLQAMLFVNFTTELDAFKSKYNDVAVLYKGNEVRFLLGDVEASDEAFEYFELKPEQAPVIIILDTDDQKYIKDHVQPDALAAWLKDYKDGKLKPYVKSQPIPETNDNPVKVIVRDTLQDMVFNSRKNVLLEFYAPWCGHCKNLAPILDEVVVSFESDPDDATANDLPKREFKIQGFPTVYFRSATEKFRDKGLQCRELMEMCFKDVVAGEHAWGSLSGILPDSILGSSWFQNEKEFEFENPTNNEEAIMDDYLTNNTDEGLDQINLEESEVSKRSDINKNASMEKIAEVVALRVAMSVGLKDTSLSIESVMDVVRDLP
ncbi:hypothetical protein HAX54_003399, partial [Datura stramonium]|nr:hypothetical protein [Datura stramonium]